LYEEKDGKSLCSLLGGSHISFLNNSKKNIFVSVFENYFFDVES